jgi:hypothetical protein
MLRRKNRPVGSANGTDDEDESVEDSADEEPEYYDEDAEYEDEATDEDDEATDEEEEYEDEDAEYDAEAEAEEADDADAEYEDEEYEDEDGEYYDEDADYDEDQEYADEEYDEDAEEEEFTPPTAATAVKRSWLASRPKARPATGTEEDAKQVNLVDRRERLIGYSLGGLLMALAVVSYFVDRHYVDKTNLKLQAQIHREAPWILVITLVLGLAILVATYFKRRAAVGFTLLLAGVALFNSDFLIGIVYLGAGLWLIFRAMRKSPKAAERAAARGGTTDRSSRSRTTGTAGAATPSKTTATTETKSVPGRTIGRNRRISSTASPSGRYTPPKASRPVPPPAKSEPEPSNRISAWLKK